MKTRGIITKKFNGISTFVKLALYFPGTMPVNTMKK